MQTTTTPSAAVRNVKIVPNAKSGQIITASKNPAFGFLQLEEVSESFEMGWLRTHKKSTLVRAEITALQKLVNENRTLALPGKIVVQEFPENEVPEKIFNAFLKTKDGQDPEEILKGYLKRAGNDGPVLMTGDQRILRFTWYDRSGLTADIKCDHDNASAGATPVQAQVVEAQTVPNVAEAAMPGA